MSHYPHVDFEYEKMDTTLVILHFSALDSPDSFDINQAQSNIEKDGAFLGDVEDIMVQDDTGWIRAFQKSASGRFEVCVIDQDLAAERFMEALPSAPVLSP